MSAITVAVLSSTLTYLTTRKLSRRANQLAHINKQISELYGPLHALSKSAESSWNEFRKKYGNGRVHLLEDPEFPPTEKEVDAWKYWLRHVFMPLNRKMYEVLLSKTDLIEGDDIPECLLKFCAHVNGYEVTLAHWEADDYTTLVSVINHPGLELHSHISNMYRELKKKQVVLLSR